MFNKKIYRILVRWLPLSLILLLLICFFYFHLYRFFTFDTLKQHKIQLFAWTEQHKLRTIILFMLVYILSVAASFPGATFLTVLAGFLFGIFIGTLSVVISATIGSIIIFLAVKTSFGHLLATHTSKHIKKMEAGLRENAFNYLLILRLLPIFPFWVVNIVPALLNIRLSTFVIATFLGIIPCTLIYVSLGHGLNHILNLDQTPDLKIIFEPKIIIPLILLSLFALLPVVYKTWRNRRK